MNQLVSISSSPALPALVAAAGERAGVRFLEFFAANIRNPHTRRAYARAAEEFLAWCADAGVPSIVDVQPLHVGTWIEAATHELAAPSVKQRLAAIRHLFDWLVTGQVVPVNPSSSVRGPSHVVTSGQTPVLDPSEARALLDSIDIGKVAGLRDRALIGLMVYSFARIGAALGMTVEDVYTQNRRLWVRLREKGGKRHAMPCHHNLEEYLVGYLDGVGLRDDPILLFVLSIGAELLTHALGFGDNSPVFALLITAALVVTAIFAFRMLTNPMIQHSGDRPDATHGSARFAADAEARRLTQSAGGLLIGRDRKTGRPLRYDGPAHLLTMAPTRSGKGVGTIIPNLLTADRSVICIDPKGENAHIAGRARNRFGPIHVLDPFAVTGLPSAAFNPLAGLDPNGLDVAEDAATLADALVYDAPGEAGEAHWNEEAKALIAGIVLYVGSEEPPERRTLATLREHLTAAPDAFSALLGRMQGTAAAGGLIARAANRHRGKDNREAAGVLSAAQRHTHFLDSPRMTAVLDHADFAFADLDLHGLAAQQPLQFAHAVFETTYFGRCHHLVVGAHRFLASLAHQPPPAEHQAGAQPVATGNVADRHAGLHRLGNHGELQLGGKAPPAGDPGNHFNLRERVGHRRMPRIIPRPSG